jgi:hypothetical protein
LILVAAGALAEGIMQNSGRVPRESLMVATTFVVQFAISCVPLAILRKPFGWRLCQPDADAETIEARTQYSILSILLWTLEVAVFLAFLQYLAHSGRHVAGAGFTFDAFTSGLTGGLLLSTAGIVILTLVSSILARGRARLVVTAIFLFATAAFDAYLWIDGSFTAGYGVATVAAFDAGLILPPVLFASVLRVCGYRLVSAATSHSTAETLKLDIASHRRFGPTIVTFLFLLSLLAAIAWQAIRIIPTRREYADQMRWGDLGFSAMYSDHKLASLTAIAGNAIGDEQLSALRQLDEVPPLSLAGNLIAMAQLERLSKITRIRDLDLSGASLIDADLDSLAQMTSLEEINLSRTSITDAGVQQLRMLPNLRHLALDATKVTDAGLAELGHFEKLARIDVLGTAVTPYGVAQVKLDRPDLEIHFSFGNPPAPQVSRSAPPQ